MKCITLKNFSAFDNDYRVIPTGLCGVKAYEILRSIEGQLSDGRWENTPQMEKYWKNEYVILGDEPEDPEIFIIVSNKKYETKKVPSHWSLKYGQQYCYKYIDNPFVKMSDMKIRKWFADKIHSMVKYEQEDNGQKNWWTKNIDQVLDYLGYENTITVADCKMVVKKLKSF